MKQIYYRVQGYFLWHTSYSDATYYVDRSEPISIETKTYDEMDLIDISNIASSNII